MRILADSHVAYWAMTRPRALKPLAHALLIDPANEIWVSSATIWELEIKACKGMLVLPETFVKTLREENFAELPVTWGHAQSAAGLPMHHADPFDRMLIAQARAEGLVLMTRDLKIGLYDVPTCPA